MSTVGTFTKYEPLFEFPGVDEAKGHLRWGRRDAEFSGGSTRKARQHEVQLGQNHESVFQNKANCSFTISVADAASHWPRLWRVCLDDNELSEMQKMTKAEKSKLEPTNEHPRQVNDRLFKLFSQLDRSRVLNLAHPDEGIAYVSYEVHVTHRCEFNMQEFPFDMHDLDIVVRLGAHDRDPMARVLVPVAHDKAFFVSSRVAKLSGWSLSRNMHWHVTREPYDQGGFQRLTASVVLRRKPGHFIRNHILYSFLLTTTQFCAFASRADEFPTRVFIMSSVILLLVTFKYGSAYELPGLSYPTILDDFVLKCFYLTFILTVVIYAFSIQCTWGGNLSTNPKHITNDVKCTRFPGHMYGIYFIPVYSPQFETGFAIIALLAWVGGNYWYWNKVWNRFQHNTRLVEQSGLGWMKFKTNQKGGSKGHYDTSKLVRDRPVPLDNDHVISIQQSVRKSILGAGVVPESVLQTLLPVDATPLAPGLATSGSAYRGRSRSVVDVHGPVLGPDVAESEIELALRSSTKPPSEGPRKASARRSTRSLSFEEVQPSPNRERTPNVVKVRLVELENEKKRAVSDEDFERAQELEEKITDLRQQRASFTMGSRLGTSLDDVLAGAERKGGAEMVDPYHTPPILRSGSTVGEERNPMAPPSGASLASLKSSRSSTQPTRSLSSDKHPSKGHPPGKKKPLSRSVSASRQAPTSRSSSTTTHRAPASRPLSTSKRPPASRSASNTRDPGHTPRAKR